MNLTSINRIIISRTDSIGDVILTLPLAGILKKEFPNSEIYFLASSYTRDVVECCKQVDQFIDYSEIEKWQFSEQIDFFKIINADLIIHAFPRKEIAVLAQKANIKYRIGTSHRWYNVLYCNKRVSFSRKKSALHESELNLKLLKPLKICIENFKFKDLHSTIQFNVTETLNENEISFLNADKVNIILHPKSKGSAREWSLSHFSELITLLPSDKFHFILTGTESEGRQFRNELLQHKFENVVDSSGKLSLKGLISLISKADILVACSTGPLHIAGLCMTSTIGLFPPIRPMHPGRWQPIGVNVKIFCKEKACNKCRKKTTCDCLDEISAKEIAQYILQSTSLNYR